MNNSYEDALNIENIWIYRLWYRFFGFIEVIRSPEKFMDNYESYWVKLSEYNNIVPISFIILHNKHYTTVYINNEHVYYYDPSGSPPPRRYLNLIRKFANDIRRKDMPLIYNKNIHQGDSGNCGPFALKYLFSQYYDNLYFDWNTEINDSTNMELMIERFRHSGSYNILFTVNYIVVSLFLILFMIIYKVYDLFIMLQHSIHVNKDIA